MSRICKEAHPHPCIPSGSWRCWMHPWLQSCDVSFDVKARRLKRNIKIRLGLCTVRVGITVGPRMVRSTPPYENYDPPTKITTPVFRHTKMTTRNNKGFQTRADSVAPPWGPPWLVAVIRKLRFIRKLRLIRELGPIRDLCTSTLI